MTSLTSVGSSLGLPPKLDVDNVMVKPSDSHDVTNMLIYNARNSDLHAWVTRELSTCGIMYNHQPPTCRSTNSYTWPKIAIFMWTEGCK